MNWRVRRKRISEIWLYAVSTTSMMIGVAAQSVAFLIVARYLGKTNYGHLATLTALTSIVAPWVQFGSAELMRRRVAADVAFYPRALGHGLIVLWFIGSIATFPIALVLVNFVHFGDGRLGDFLVVWLFAMSAQVMFPWMVLVEQIFLAHEMFPQANLTNAGFGAWRAVVAALACFGFGVRTIGEWAVWNFAAYVIASLVGALAIARFGKPIFRVVKDELPIGATFGVSGFLYNLRTNVDILALSAVSPPELVGAYGLARRVVSIAIVTGASLDRLVYSRLVRASQHGLHKAAAAAAKFASYAILITGATALVLYVVAPSLVPKLFGASYRDAAHLVRLLCGLIVIISLQNLAFDGLNSAGLHRIQVAISSFCVAIGAGLVALLTSNFAVPGAISGVYIMEISLMIALWTGLGLVAHPTYLPRLTLLLNRIHPIPRG